jgi:hypothetical protein
MVSQYSGAKPLIQVRKQDLLSGPPATWLPDRPTDEEILKEVGAWPDRQQATYALFNQDFDKAIQLLEAEPFSRSEIESLLVLGLSYCPSGLNKPQKARSCFDAMLSLAPSGSLWEREAKTALRRIDADSASLISAKP